MLTHRINTLEELQAEQDLISANARVIRQELFRSVKETTSKGRNFLLKDVLLPAAAIGLGAFVAQQLSSRGSSTDLPLGHAGEEGSDVREHSSGWFSKLMLFALPFLQQYFLSAKPAKTADGNAPDGEHHNGLHADRWPPTFALLVIPFLQQYLLKKSAMEHERSIKLEVDGNEVLEGTMDTGKSGGATAIFETLYKLLPVVLPLVQQYFADRHNEQVEGGSSSQHPNNSQRSEWANG